MVTYSIWCGVEYLGSIGVIDFAGGLVVHATCGVLVAAMMLGPRKGFPGGSLVPKLWLSGAAMLWVGWFGFNGGSSIMAILVTHISAAVGALTWMFVEWIKTGKPTIWDGGRFSHNYTCIRNSKGALLIGLLAGIICFYATQMIKSYFKIDDSLDVFPVHGVGGILGI